MKKAEMLERVMAGDAMIPGTYVLLKKDVIDYTVKKGANIGQAAQFNKVSHAIASSKHGVIFVLVDSRKIPGFDMAKYESPFKPGQQVVAVVTDKMTTNMGIKTVSGELHPIEP